MAYTSSQYTDNPGVSPVTVSPWVLSNNAVCVNELASHLRVPAGLINEGQVEGDLPPQVHLIVRYALVRETAQFSSALYLRLCCTCINTYLQPLSGQR